MFLLFGYNNESRLKIFKYHMDYKTEKNMIIKLKN